MNNLLALLALALPAAGDAIEMPKVLDDRLAIELFAAEPDLVTPTGIAVDARGRVLVVECHTHFPPEGYAGPKADRIRMFEDADGDGRAERITTFFEGSHATMNLAVYHDGTVYVATRSEVFRLRDADGDGQADERTPIARLETQGDYPHNGLSGFAFDFAGNVYFGMGENSGADYKLIGSDGTTLAGGGEGGNIYRCGAGGEKLERIATGFWNPFHLCYDAFGRLFAVDNDPDSRPPCRLLHIVPQGDYGYRYRNGRKGLHPFTAWNGELPGTLPMVAGTGEAPSGIVAYESGGLPADYLGELLVTSWGDHRLDRFKLVTRGASFTSTAKPFVTGGENFRPVGIAVAPDGSLYVSDWVDKSYTLHGKGRIWHVRAKKPVATPPPSVPANEIWSVWRDRRERAARELLTRNEEGVETLRKLIIRDRSATFGSNWRTPSRQFGRVQALVIEALSSVDEPNKLYATMYAKPRRDDTISIDAQPLAVRLLPSDELTVIGWSISKELRPVRAEILRRLPRLLGTSVVMEALHELDPFIRQAALAGLRRLATVDELVQYASSEDAAIRIAALLLLRDGDDPRELVALSKFFDDTDPTIRFAAVQWVGEHVLADFRPQVETALASADTRQLFEGCLAALELLDRAAKGEPRPPADHEIAGEEYVLQILADPRAAPQVRRRALRMLRADHPLLTYERLGELFATDDIDLKLEVVRTLRDSPIPERNQWLSSLSDDDKQPTVIRAEAIVGLVSPDPAFIEQLVGLAAGDEPTLRAEALRSLRGAPLSEEQRKKVEHLDKLRRLGVLDDDTGELALRLLRAWARPTTPDVGNVAAWNEMAKGEGDAAAGERIFFHSRAAGCYRCHQVDGRGGRIGPELSTTARQLDRAKLIESIVAPSKEIAPRFAAWSIVTTDGKTLTGMLVSEAVTGEQSYADAEGQIFVLRPEQIDQRVPHDKSIMPDNLVGQLTTREFRDLLAFLQGR
jgi:putative membrane-bound dehydrogenase-like protein